MRTSRRLFGVVAAIALVAAACGSDDDGDATTADTTAGTEATDSTEAPTDTEAPATTEATDDTTATTIEGRGDADLVFWLDDTRATALAPFVEDFAAETGLNVKIVEVAEDVFRTSVNQVIPTGEGPDVFVGAHDWVGEMVANGIVAPVELGASEADYNPIAIEAVSIGDTRYGLPYAVENVGLLRNTDLVPEAPATFADLETTALALRDEGTISVPLAVQGEGGAPYHYYPMYTSFGAEVFAQNEDGSYDTSQLGLDAPEGLAAAEAFGGWYDSELLSQDVTYDIMIESFSSGEAPFAITGPWAIPQITENNPDLNFVIEPIPPAGDQVSSPFIGAQAFYVSAFSENQALALTFLLDYVNTPEAMADLFEAQPRTPAYTPTFDEVSSDPVLAGFATAGENGEPLPNIPEMGAVFTPWSDAYVAISQGTDPTQAFTAAAEQIRDAL
jgi:arabinogalactan oligomer / maltooligosaccharide transport system substrate-binding protein